VSDGPPSSALRVMQRHLADPRVLSGMAVVALLLGFAGPFGTYDELGTLPRLGYWTAIVFATYGVGYAVSVLAGRALARLLPADWLRLLVVGVLAGLPITLAVVVVNLLAFGAAGWHVIGLASLWPNVTLIAIGVLVISLLLERAMAPPATAADPADEAPPALLERLPLPQRGPLLSLSVADHYVDVVTARGHALLLMRLSDAIGEARPTLGLQIHRSHWVALDAVARTLRVDGRLVVELRDGRRLPVSRSYAEAVRRAGLLV